MYSLSVPGHDKHNKIRVKEVKKAYVKKNIRHKQFHNTLKNLTSTVSKFCSFASKQHTIQTVEICKACLNTFDDKRYLLHDSIHTLTYGHKDIPVAIPTTDVNIINSGDSIDDHVIVERDRMRNKANSKTSTTCLLYTSDAADE